MSQGREWKTGKAEIADFIFQQVQYIVLQTTPVPSLQREQKAQKRVGEPRPSSQQISKTTKTLDEYYNEQRPGAPLKKGQHVKVTTDESKKDKSGYLYIGGDENKGLREGIANALSISLLSGNKDISHSNLRVCRNGYGRVSVEVVSGAKSCNLSVVLSPKLLKDFEGLIPSKALADAMNAAASKDFKELSYALTRDFELLQNSKLDDKSKKQTWKSLCDVAYNFAYRKEDQDVVSKAKKKKPFNIKAVVVVIERAYEHQAKEMRRLAAVMLTQVKNDKMLTPGGIFKNWFQRKNEIVKDNASKKSAKPEIGESLERIASGAHKQSSSAVSSANVSISSESMQARVTSVPNADGEPGIYYQANGLRSSIQADGVRSSVDLSHYDEPSGVPAKGPAAATEPPAYMNAQALAKTEAIYMNSEEFRQLASQDATKGDIQARKLWHVTSTAASDAELQSQREAIGHSAPQKDFKALGRQLAAELDAVRVNLKNTTNVVAEPEYMNSEDYRKLAAEAASRGNHQAKKLLVSARLSKESKEPLKAALAAAKAEAEEGQQQVYWDPKKMGIVAATWGGVKDRKKAFEAASKKRGSREY